MTLELSIIMPCLNEAETLGACIEKARDFLEHHKIKGEIVVADNGSTDDSQQIALDHGAQVVNVEERGYGSALLGGINAARGKYIIMGDADDSYDFSYLTPFIEKLHQGYHLVMGNRFKGGIAPGAMPWLHRYLGNPVLTGIGRLFFKSPVGDFHCGLRGFSKEAVEKLDLRATGMEFASEMIVKATLYHFRITEVATTLSPDGRSRPPHLRSWRDGWRHLRFLLIYSPRWLFLYPGAFLMLAGLAALVWLFPAARTIGGVTFDIHTLLYAAFALILGLQFVAFALFSKVFAIGSHLMPPDPRINTIVDAMTLERGLIFGGLLSLMGVIGSVYAVIVWGGTSFGALLPSSMMRIVIPSVTTMAVGIQIIFATFFLSILKLKHK